MCAMIVLQCLVYFRVEADRKLFGQNCIPVVSLQQGTKQLSCIPMYLGVYREQFLSLACADIL